MWNKIAIISSLASLLWSPAANAGDSGNFTFLPKGGVTPFEATCFDNIATAKIMTWKEFQEKEFQNRLKLELGLQKNELQFEIDALNIKLEESTLRFEEMVRLRDEEITDLRGIIKKDRKVNIPLVIAGSITAGIAIGIGGAYAIDKALN